MKNSGFYYLNQNEKNILDFSLEPSSNEPGNKEGLSVDIRGLVTAEESGSVSDILRDTYPVNLQFILDSLFVGQQSRREFGPDNTRGDSIDPDVIIEEGFGHDFDHAQDSSLSDRVDSDKLVRVIPDVRADKEDTGA